MILSQNRTKIVATLGPASSSKEIIEKMIIAGVNVFRLNFSHGDHSDVEKLVQIIRKVSQKLESNVGILADLQGPKIRIGTLEHNIAIKKGNTITLSTLKDDGNIYISYKSFAQDVKPGETILVDDGKLQFKVVSSDNKHLVVLKALNSGILKQKKGVNLPNTQVSLPSLTEKDLEDLNFILGLNVEWIALSFVRRAEDILDLKQRLKAAGSHAKVIAKIEKPEAIKHIDAIIDATDAVMVARGDLGVEAPIDELPLVQKMIVRKCIGKVKPVIIATQMMESMIENPSPTRAEANDIANSVLDGADAVMLSGETSVGSYPVQCIKVMSKIIHNIEKTSYPYTLPSFPNKPLNKKRPTFFSESILYSACALADQTGAKAIVSMTNSGFSAFQLSNHRPQAFTVIFTSNKHLINTFSLIWGVRAFYYDRLESTDQTFEEVNEFLLNQKLVKKGDVIINTASIPIKKRGRTNMIKISLV
jgi:pyruvate kinase